MAATDPTTTTASGAKAPDLSYLVTYLPAALAASLFVYFCRFIPAISAGERVTWSADWVPSMNISAAFLVDGLSLTFALLITGIGALVMLFAARYLKKYAHRGRFALYMTLFMLSMLGLVLADDLLFLFVFWELTTITSYLLIGFGHDNANSRRSALQALLVTGMGGLAFLAGLLLAGIATGTYSISGINDAGSLAANPLYGAILVLILLGAFTKSAQVPLHFWLPNAMAAPTPVSAYLHSATMVKGGVYLLARMHPSLSGTDAWMWSLAIFGGITAVFASVMALRQTDLKQVLAYTTLMALGTLVMFLSDPGGYAITGAMTFLVVHSLYKAALFLAVGAIDHSTGTREATVLGGLGRAMPVTAVAAGLAALSMAGLPPFLGFIGKELLYKGAEGAVTSAPYVIAMAFAANAMMVAAAGVVALRPFWGKAGGATPKTPKEAPWQLLAGPAVLGALGLVFGLYPSFLQDTLIHPKVASVLGTEEEAKDLVLWAGVNLALILSLATFAAGALFYLAVPRIRAAMPPGWGLDSDIGWDRFLDGLKALAGWQTRVLQSGLLTRYMTIIFASLAAVLGLAIALRMGSAAFTLPAMPYLLVKEWAVGALIVAGTLLTLATRSRIAAICGLGVVGIGVAIIFIVYGAPDVAITQLLVETLVVVLVAVAVLRLPQLERDAFRPLHAAIAGALGVMVTVVLLRVVEQPFDKRLTQWFEITAWPEAYGRNIVNVIRVDFRALDTFGEVAVVAVAALAGFALLKGRVSK